MTTTTYYLTKEGLEKVKKEYQKLLDFKKAKAKDEVPNIWHSEDVNPEYLSFQEDMSLLETKIAEHENILRSVELIKPPKKSEQNTINLGAVVSLEIEGEIDEFQIVGTLEADPSQRKISNESPLGQGLLGAKVGDAVKIETSIVNHNCKILKIRYV